MRHEAEVAPVFASMPIEASSGSSTWRDVKLGLLMNRNPRSPPKWA
jgi:hypothetical protein